MSADVLAQKKLMLPYLDKIEYINCQLRQRGLLPEEEPRGGGVQWSLTPATEHGKSATKPLPHSAHQSAMARNQDDQEETLESVPVPVPVKFQIPMRVLRVRYPRFFEALDPSKPLPTPRERGITWVLHLIEVVYNALTELHLLQPGTSGDADKSGTRLAMPQFTWQFLLQSLGLPDLAQQEALDLMFNLELRREQFPPLALFASFLRELLDSDTLLFFLIVRHQLQVELDLNLAAKDKQTSSSQAKKFLTAELVEFRNHPLVPDGTKQVWLSSTACEHVLQRVFDFSRRCRVNQTVNGFTTPLTLAQHVVRELLANQFAPKDAGYFPVSAETWLAAMIQLFQEVAEDILAQFKYNDDGRKPDCSLGVEASDSHTITLEANVAKWLTLYGAQERALRLQKIEFMKLQRSNTTDQLRIQLRLLQNRIGLQEQELSHTQAKIKDAERLVSSVWQDVVALSPSTSPASSASKELVSVLGRFEAHVARLHRKHDIAVKASLLLAVPWQQQLEALKLRMIIRIQRAYRAKRRSREIKHQARTKLSAQLLERELKLKAQQLEQKRLAAVREKDMERHQQRLKAKNQQEEEVKRVLALKQTQLVQKAREEDAKQRAAIRRKKQLQRMMAQWKRFVVLASNRRKAHRLFLKLQFCQWKRQFKLFKRLARAARTIQRFIRHRSERKRLLKLFNLRQKRNKVAKKYLLKVQSRLTNRVFNHWVGFTLSQQQLRANFAAIVQKREGYWFQRWNDFIAMWKRRKVEAARLIQRQYRGRIARQVFRMQRTRHRQALAIQSVYRGYQGRQLFSSLKAVQTLRNNGANALLRRIQLREAALCFVSLRRNVYCHHRIAQMAQARQLASKRRLLAAWLGFVAEEKETRAALFRLRYSAAVSIQRTYRRFYCQRRYLVLRRLNRAARSIQHVFRGFLGRQAALKFRWESNAARQIQTLYRRHQAQLLVLSLRTEKLLLAAFKGDYSTVKRAFDRGFWDVRDAEGNGLLHLSATAGHKRLVKLCLRCSLDINLVNRHSQTPLHLLLANLPVATESDLDMTRLHQERVALAAYMIEHGAWHEAPDTEGFTPLLLCASLGQTEAVEMLLDHGANTEAKTWQGNLNAVQLTVEGNHPATFQALLESRSFDTGETGQITQFLLHACAGRGLVDCLRVLITHFQHQPDAWLARDPLNQRDTEGYTPLVYATSNGFVEIVQCLLEAGASPDLTDFFGRSPLHFALLYDQPKAQESMVQLLVLYETDVNARDTDGDVPLHVSCQTDARLSSTRLLLTNGAVLCANALGNHPTHIAASHGAVATLQLLVEYGGDLNLKNYDGKTPLGMARMSDQPAIVQYIADGFAHEAVASTAPQDLDPLLEDEQSLVGQERTLVEWREAVSHAYCMGSLAEWTQYIDAESEMPFYYSPGTSESPLFTWDAPVEFDAALGELWEIVRGSTTDEDSSSGQDAVRCYLYHNRVTDELSTAIPPIDYALLQDVVQQSKRHKQLRLRVRKVSADELSASAMEYLRFFRGFEAERAQTRAELRAATTIQRHFRAKRTRWLIKTLLKQNRCAVELQRAFRGRRARLQAAWLRQQHVLAVKLQSVWRGHLARQREARGLGAQRRLHLKRRLAARVIQRGFRRFVTRRRRYREVLIQQRGPKSYFDWEALRQRAVVRRSFKVWDELEAPADFPGVPLYCHQVTRVCSWSQPPPWIAEDRAAFETRRQLRLWGYTSRMQQAAVTLQSLWRARVARISFRLILRSVHIMKSCEREYLEDPTHLSKLGNYALYLHTVEHAYDRARPLYGRLLRAMAQRGPDLPFVLFSYGLFLYITREEDTALVEEMILRGKLADPTLVSYKVAVLGFFRQAVLLHPEDAEAHINYAACLHWLYDQYDEAATHYLRALAAAPHRAGTLEIFQDMLDRRRRIERAKLTPRSRKAMDSQPGDDPFDAFAVFVRWQAKQAEAEDLARRLAFQAAQDAEERLQAARKIQARYRRRNAVRKVTRLKLEYKLAAIKAEQAQQQALYNCVVAAFDALAASNKKTKKQDVLSVPVGQLDAVFAALQLPVSASELKAASALFRKQNPKLKHVNVLDLCRFLEKQPSLTRRAAPVAAGDVSSKTAAAT
ncbi:hypothetical protein BBJ28_00000721 [Nothophytophthora sp. Chile5]|nr:hypothetical protein BBJ28_00000721 [Nothophytophthora sp. Chile5]